MKIPFVLALFCSTCALGQAGKPFDYSIIFTELFQTDTVQLSIDGKIIVQRQVLNSISTGTTGFRIVQRTNRIEVFSGNQRLKTYKYYFLQPTKVVVTVNGKSNEFLFDFGKGKYLLISYNKPTQSEISFAQAINAIFL